MSLIFKINLALSPDQRAILAASIAEDYLLDIRVIKARLGGVVIDVYDMASKQPKKSHINETERNIRAFHNLESEWLCVYDRLSLNRETFEAVEKVVKMIGASL